MFAQKEVYDKFGSLGIHVGELVGFNKVERYLTKRSAGYKFTTVMLFLLTGCCFCCCCYFCFCFCCGLCLPKKDGKTAKAIEDGNAKSQNPYYQHLAKEQKSWNEKVITEQPKNKKPPTTPMVEIKDSDTTTQNSDKNYNKSGSSNTNQNKSLNSQKHPQSMVDRGERASKRTNHPSPNLSDRNKGTLTHMKQSPQVVNSGSVRSPANSQRSNLSNPDHHRSRSDQTSQRHSKRTSSRRSPSQRSNNNNSNTNNNNGRTSERRNLGSQQHTKRATEKSKVDSEWMSYRK
ncbi:uncharacterized protein LOC142338548 [Convolutriloba macropyga]|uniref:uncharacterized protein LOC142338548 n=1 Tax=Convolutriloba macropyga TaxID=536237 RepID=UPI003F52078D